MTESDVAAHLVITVPANFPKGTNEPIPRDIPG